MNISDVFLGTKYIKKSEHIGIVFSEWNVRKIGYTLFLREDVMFGIDILDKNRIALQPYATSEGDIFIDGNKVIPFRIFIDDVQKKYNISVNLKSHMTRRQILKLMNNISEQIKNKEQEEKVKKLIKTEEGGGKR